MPESCKDCSRNVVIFPIGKLLYVKCKSCEKLMKWKEFMEMN